MQVFLGDRVTLVKNESYITGAVTGVVLGQNKTTRACLHRTH
jgi:hypothetical protein